MKHIPRSALADQTQARLHQWTAELVCEPEGSRPGKAYSAWRQRRGSRILSEVQGTLVHMNQDRERCMYCEHNEAKQIDHFEPRKVAPQRTFDWANLLLACDVCNSNTKRTQHTRADGVVLLDPTADDPSAHLELRPLDGALDACTERGAWTIQVFQLNERAILKQQRKRTWDGLQRLIEEYATVVARGDLEAAADVRAHICAHPFPSVLLQILSIAQDPNPLTVLRPACLAALRAHPEIATWAETGPREPP